MGHYDSCFEQDAIMKCKEAKKQLKTWIKNQIKDATIYKLRLLYKVSQFDDTEVVVTSNFVKTIIRGEK